MKVMYEAVWVDVDSKGIKYAWTYNGGLSETEEEAIHKCRNHSSVKSGTSKLLRIDKHEVYD